MTEIVQVDDQRALLALSRWQLSMQENEELLRQIGSSMLLSVRRTFREQGSPEGSWAPLSPNTVRSNPRVYGPGHKLLILTGRLLHSITYRVMSGAVEIGTNLIYAAVHQFGSRDWHPTLGPRTEDEMIRVGEHTRKQSRFSGYREHLERQPSAAVEGPPAEGRKRAPRIRLMGPRNLRREHVLRIGPLNVGKVGAHTRRQNIPPRPYLVFRPNDLQRIRNLTVAYLNRRAREAGLEVASGMADAGLGSAI